MVIVPDSRHTTPIDSPDLFNRIVIDFMDAVEQGRGGQWSDVPNSKWPAMTDHRLLITGDSWRHPSWGRHNRRPAAQAVA